MNLRTLGALKMEPEDSLWVRFFRIVILGALLKMAVLAILLMLFFGPWPVFAQGSPREAENNPVPEPPQYVIQPNDLLEIVVWGEPDISRMVLVRPDGRISLPLVQDIRASELTPVELKKQMEDLLEEYIDSPNVTVIVSAIESYKIYVLGKVLNPGQIVHEKPLTVLQALTLAGGFQDYADKSEIRIIRFDGRGPYPSGKEEFPVGQLIFEFDFDDVTKGKTTEQNIFLRSGDVVVVP